jgi:hypothetical protein
MGRKREKHPILIEEFKGKRLFRRHEAWTEEETYIKIYFEETDWEVVDCIQTGISGDHFEELIRRFVFNAISGIS